MTRHIAFLGAPLLVLAACAAPPVPPVLSLGDRECTVQPALNGASAVPFDSTSGITAKIDATSNCLATKPGKATYAAFLLPAAPTPYTVTVRSLLTGTALLSPRLIIENAQGSVTRTVEPQQFRPGITGLQTGLRISRNERYLIAAADAATLGQSITLHLAMRDMPRVQVAAGAPVFIPIFIVPNVPAQPTELAVVFSLNGRVQVSAAPVAMVR